MNEWMNEWGNCAFKRECLLAYVDQSLYAYAFGSFHLVSKPCFGKFPARSKCDDIISPSCFPLNLCRLDSGSSTFEPTNQPKSTCSGHVHRCTHTYEACYNGKSFTAIPPGWMIELYSVFQIKFHKNVSHYWLECLLFSTFAYLNVVCQAQLCLASSTSNLPKHIYIRHTGTYDWVWSSHGLLSSHLEYSAQIG